MIQIKRKLLILFLMIPFMANAQISGIVNSYTNVTAVLDNFITVGSSASFSVGDHVIIMQMKGATIDETNTIAFGDILNYNSAGYYEYGIIISITGAVIKLELPPCRDYEISAHVQLIRVPVYADVTIVGTITAMPWDGVIGGVLAIESTGTITFNADIDVSGQGFLGGNYCYAGFSCGVDDFYSNYSGAGFGLCIGGEKGEGIAEIPSTLMGSRGKLANGGGGSNSGQHGGAGGGSFGGGGVSGYQWTGCPSYESIWAYGGQGLDYTDNRIFLGGGGGGGHQDNGLSVTAGANGGGIVILKAATIDGLGNAIYANGNDVTVITDSEGAGAGGAAGSILLIANNYPSALNIYANGGGGGNIESTLWAGTCHGPGGGGGGGFIGTNLLVFPGSVTIAANGGAAGIITSPGAFCDGTTHGAASGDLGGVVTNVSNAFTYPIVNLGPNATECIGSDPFVLDAGPGLIYLWQDGSTNQTYDVYYSGTYNVTVSNAFGCSDQDTITITILPSPPLNFPDTIQFCEGNSVAIDAGIGYTSYLWQDGTTGQSIDISAAGVYYCTVSNASGCITTDTIHVPFLYSKPVVDLGEDTVVCIGSAIYLYAANTDVTYYWQDASTNQTFTVIEPGVYSVEVTTPFNCQGSDEIVIGNGCDPDIFMPNAFSPNGDGLNDSYRGVLNHAILSFNMQIWDRWGQLIFEGSAIDEAWDGTFKNSALEIGAYIFIVNYTKQTFEGIRDFEIKGTTTLLR